MPSELEKKLNQKARESRILQQVSEKLNSTADLAQIYQHIFETMDGLFSFHHSLILLKVANVNELDVVASRGYEEPVAGRVKFGVGVIGTAAEKKSLLKVNNLGQQREYLASIRVKMQEAGREDELDEVPVLLGLKNSDSQIAIPLMFIDKLVGVFAVELEAGHSFSEEDETLVSIISGLAASAINNARNYKRLRKLNETLEYRVKKRTEQFHIANRELKEAQSQLVQAAKMASLGDLVAGVAHEVNTPMGSIYSNAQLIQRAHEIICKSVDSGGGQIYKDYPRLEKAVKAIGEASAISVTASNRMNEIILALRTFARLDESSFKKADLHEGMDSTLQLVKHQTKGKVTLTKEYGDIPLVTCYSNQLNQVFMNILVNSIQAIPGKGEITIQTYTKKTDVIIIIKDTGSGISEENLEKIFDPGFTTKGVGVGTGLGLAISYRIIKDHKGDIKVQSELGKGTTTTLRIPIRPE